MSTELESILKDNHESLIRIAKQFAGANEWPDLLQEISIALWRGLPGFDGRAAMSTWVYRVAINTSLQFVRKRRVPTATLDTEPLGEACSDVSLAVLDAFLRNLDPVNRALLLLDLEGLHRDEIADVLGLSPSAVATRMSRLKARFTEQYVEGEK